MASDMLVNSGWCVYHKGVWATIPQEKIVTLNCSNNRNLEIKVTKNSITFDGIDIPVSKLKGVLVYTDTFNGWTIKPEMFTIGCKEGIEREDLQKVLDTYNELNNG